MLITWAWGLESGSLEPMWKAGLHVHLWPLPLSLLDSQSSWTGEFQVEWEIVLKQKGKRTEEDTQHSSLTSTYTGVSIWTQRHACTHQKDIGWTISKFSVMLESLNTEITKLCGWLYFYSDGVENNLSVSMTLDSRLYWPLNRITGIMTERGAPGIFRDAVFILFFDLVSMGMFPYLEYTKPSL